MIGAADIVVVNSVRLTGKKQRDLLFRKFYDEYWSKDHEDPRATP